MREVGNLMKKFAGILITTLFFLHLSGISVYANDYYIVKQGDTLWQIAYNNKITVDKLKQINNLNSDFLKIGQKLLLQSTPSTTVSVAEATPSPELPSNPYTTYSVQLGDNLWKIANQYNTTVESIMQINNLSSDALFVGQQLLISSVVPIMQEVPSRSGVPFSGDRIIEVAAQYLGTPYKYGGQSPSGFDCSGFVKYVFNKFNINLNRTAAGQYSHGVPVEAGDLQVGDLVFFAAGKNIDHVGIYSGNGQFIHSSSPRSGGVIYTSLSENYYAKSYVGARRILK